MEETNEMPSWLLGRGSIDEAEFCREFCMKHHIVYQDGAFFSVDGRLSEEQLRQMLFADICPHVKSSLAAKVESCLNTLRFVARQDCLTLNIAEELYTIHAANGEFRLDTQTFSCAKQLTRFRLPVSYNPHAPKPEAWLKFLSELLHEEDIPTLQEFMGYCLVPSTMGQKMLLISGKGGEGKSRIGLVMKSLLGINMNLGSIAKVEKSPFARADLEHLLLMVDDDLKMEALDQTNYLKSIITAELPMDLERKGIQSYQGKLHVRFLAFGNGTLQALHDRSHGFFRRQILLEAKERPRDRKDDPYLGIRLQDEAEGILLWCIEGLERLLINDFRFTMSRRARENLLKSMIQSNNVVEFLKSEGYIRFDPQGCASSRALYEIYRDWCEDNALTPLKPNTFWNYLNQNKETYHLAFSTHIPGGNGRHVRGFQGLRILR